MVLISVIMPVYNVENYLDRAIKSILNQNFESYELILIDDGSTDKSGIICDKYSNEYPERVRVIHKENGGLSDSRNVGIDAARGNYYAFIDSDDTVEPTFLRTMYDISQESSSDMVICGVKIVDIFDNELDTKFWKLISTGSYNNEELLRLYYNGYSEQCVVAWNKLYNKELFKNLRYEKDRINEDEAILLNLMSAVNKVYVTEEKIYNYRIRKDSIMASLDVEDKSNNLIYEKNMMEILFNRGHYLLNNNFYGKSIAKYNLEYILWNLYKFYNKDTKSRKKYEKKFLKLLKKTIFKYGIGIISMKIGLFVLSKNIYYFLKRIVS